MKKELLFYVILAMGASTYLNAHTPQQTQEYLTSAKLRIEQASNVRASSTQIATAGVKITQQETVQVQ